MTNLDVIRKNIGNMEDSELAESLSTNQFTEEARKLAEDEFVRRGYELSDDAFAKAQEIDERDDRVAKPYKPLLLPILFATFASLAGMKVGALLFAAIGAGLLAGLFAYGGWKAGDFLARKSNVMGKASRLIVRILALVIWVLICGFLTVLGTALR